MRKIICMMLIFFSCSSLHKNQAIRSLNESDSYFVTKIDSIKNYYLIYANRNDSLFKIVSKKEKCMRDCNMIKEQMSYKFSLISYRENAFKINGINTIPVGVQGFGVDEDTFIDLEGEKGIFDIHFATNVIGLCFKK